MESCGPVVCFMLIPVSFVEVILLIGDRESKIIEGTYQNPLVSIS